MTTPKPKLLLTRNQMGWTSDQLNEVSFQFVDFCRTGACAEHSPALDIGAAYGTASLEALRAGAWVIANDLDPGHLEELERRARQQGLTRLRLKPGRFPREVHFEPDTLGAVHASNVFHFLTGNQLSEGVRAIARWLRPGGKLFVQAATPYQAAFSGFIPEYEKRLNSGVRWPGWVEKISRYSRHKKLGAMPASVHLLDDRVLSAVVASSGLVVERAWLYHRGDFPKELKLDGRESLGLVAVKTAIGLSL